MQDIRRRFFLLLLLSIGTLSLAQAVSTRFRCMWRDDPATSMVIGWDQVSGSNPVLYFDITDHGQKADLYKNSRRPDLVMAARGMNNHFVRLSGLQPNTVYYFVIRDSDGPSRRMSFKTAPNQPTERLSIIAGGDSRNNREARRSANQLVAKLRPHFVLFNGDMTGDDSAGEWRKWLDDWQSTIGSDGRLFPIIVARGNHEASNRSLLEIFDVSNPGLVYELSFGGNLLRVYSLNSMIPAGGEQRDWLENDLQKSRHFLWRFAQYHHAMRPHTSSKPEKDELVLHWAPLFYKYKVQLVSESDSHVVKWTYPIRPSGEPGSSEGFIRDDLNGTVYIGEGCWGAPLRQSNDDKPWTRASGSFNQFSWIFVDQDKVEVRVVLTDVSENVGEVNDKNLFEPPIGLSLWNPPTGDVVTLYQKPPVVAAAEPTPSQRQPDKTSTSAAKSTPTPPANDPSDWSSQPRIHCDAAGKVTVRYTLAKASEVTVLLLDEAFVVLDRVNLNMQAARTHLKELDFATLKSGNYFLVVRGADGVVAKYQLTR